METKTTGQSRLLLTIPQVQAELQVGRTTVYRLIQTEELATVRIGRSIRIPRTVVDDWLQKRLSETE